MTSTAEIKDWYKKYIKDRSLEGIILELAENNYTENHGVMEWKYVFEADMGMWKKFDLIQNKKVSIECRDDYLKEPNPVLLKMMATLAYQHIYNKDTLIWEKEKEIIWLETFKEIPGFKVQLEAQKEYWINWWKEINSKHSPLKVQETVDIFGVSVPALVYKQENDNKVKITSAIVHTSMIEDMVKNFNEFNLQGYMKTPYVNKITLSLQGDEWKFSVACNKTVSSAEKEDFKKQLAGQLSDGWGEGIEQKITLVGTDELSMAFDYEKASFYSPEEALTMMIKKTVKPLKLK